VPKIAIFEWLSFFPNKNKSFMVIYYMLDNIPSIQGITDDDKKNKKVNESHGADAENGHFRN
jgi:hypothetical protein